MTEAWAPLAAMAAVAAALALAWAWRPAAAPERGVLALLAAFALLGAVALCFGLAVPQYEPELLHLCRPTIFYAILATVLLGAPALGWGYPAKGILGTYFVFSSREWRWINLAIAVLCVLLGIANLVIAFGHPRDDWEGFKWGCMVNVVAVLILRVTFVWVDIVARLAARLQARRGAPPP